MFLRPLWYSICSTTLYLACTHDMLLLRHPRTAKSLAGIHCFLRPREWFPLGTEHLLLLLHISCQWTRQTVEPTWSSAALAKSSDKKFFAGTFTAPFVGFPIFVCEGTTQPNQRNKENYVKKIAIVKRERARNSLIFRCWCW